MSRGPAPSTLGRMNPSDPDFIRQLRAVLDGHVATVKDLQLALDKANKSITALQAAAKK